MKLQNGQSGMRSIIGIAGQFRKRIGFVLIEVMLGVSIFSIGVLALGQCVNNCVQAENAKNDDRRARMALANRLAEIEGASVDPALLKQEELKGMFKGITIKQQVKPLKLKNENKEEINNLYEVQLEAVWNNGKEPQSKVLNFYVQRGQ